MSFPFSVDVSLSEDLRQALMDLDMPHVHVRSYSGRGMYGKVCVGVTVGRQASWFKVVFALHQVLSEEHEPQDVEELLESARQDSMGLDTIHYWPQVAAPDPS